jgi:KDO2-lipid IV(A) lauroyltransferase
VTATVHNRDVDGWLQARRKRLGMEVLPRERGLRPVVERLATGGVVAVLLDQNTRVASEPVDFLGHPAPTARGFARLALQRGTPVLPIAIARRGNGHEVRCLRPLRPPAVADRGAELELLTLCNTALGELVRRNPVEWVWFHDRWGMGQASRRSTDSLAGNRKEGSS